MTQYRLTREALAILKLLHVGDTQYEKLANTITEKGEVQVRLRGGDALTFKNPRWFEEATEYKPGGWNDAAKVRPPKEGAYLVREATSDGEYDYRVIACLPDGGFPPASWGKGAQFREIPS